MTKQNTKKIAAALTILLSAGMLSGCGDTQTQSADTSSMIAEQTVAAGTKIEIEDTRGDLNGDGSQDVADAQLLLEYYTENTLGGKKLSWDELLGEENAERSDKAAAKRVLEKYLEACKEKDAISVLKYSGLGDVLRLTEGRMMSDEEIAADLMGDDIQQVDSYTIGEPTANAEQLAEFQEAVQEALNGAAEVIANQSASADDLRMAFMIAYLLKPAAKMYMFPLTITAEGKTQESEVAVICDDKGEWRLETGIGLFLVGFMDIVKSSEYASANMAASSIYKAANSASIDMVEEGVDVGLLAGVHQYSGADFVGLTEQQYDPSTITAEQALAEMRYLISRYYSDAAELESVCLKINAYGVCEVTAVQTKTGDRLMIGTYPACDDLTENMTLQEAMEKAAAAKG